MRMDLAVSLTLLLLAGGPLIAQTPERKNTCVTCHTALGGEFAAPVEAMQSDIHHQRGLSCSDCHGGDPSQEDPTRAMDPGKGFVGKPAPAEIPRFCGRCHSNTAYMRKFNPSPRVDQETEYYTSIHGKRLKQGDRKVATCISCHGYHGIRAISDTNAPVFPLHVADTCGKCHANADYMRPYSIPTDQLAQYKKSVHGQALLEKQDLSAPTCNDCHGNHGATPPGVESVANVCGTCHVRQSELFDKSPHQPAFEAMQLAGCVTCHGNHEIHQATDRLLGVGEGAVCVRCHTQGDPGFAAAGKMRNSIDHLAGSIERADELLQKAAEAGMEVSRPQFELSDARSQLTNARVVVHSFSPPEVESAAKPGLAVAQKSYQAGVAAMNERHVRRIGLAVSLVVIFLAVWGIYAKVRRMESGSQ